MAPHYSLEGGYLMVLGCIRPLRTGTQLSGQPMIIQKKSLPEHPVDRHG